MGRTPDPTPDEIRQRCLEIQAGWDEETRSRRKTIPGKKPLRDINEAKNILRLKRSGFKLQGIIRHTGFDKQTILAVLRGDYYNEPGSFYTSITLNPFSRKRLSASRNKAIYDHGKNA